MTDRLVKKLVYYRDQLVLDAYYKDELTMQQIADVFNTSRQAVYRILNPKKGK